MEYDTKQQTMVFPANLTCCPLAFTVCIVNKASYAMVKYVNVIFTVHTQLENSEPLFTECTYHSGAVCRKVQDGVVSA